jgi:hypothetical protein
MRKCWNASGYHSTRRQNNHTHAVRDKSGQGAIKKLARNDKELDHHEIDVVGLIPAARRSWPNTIPLLSSCSIF